MSGDDYGGDGKQKYRILQCNRSMLIGGDWDQLEATEDLAEDPNLYGGKRHENLTQGKISRDAMDIRTGNPGE